MRKNSRIDQQIAGFYLARRGAARLEKSDIERNKEVILKLVNVLAKLNFGLFLLAAFYAGSVISSPAQAIASETVYKLRNQCSDKIVTVQGGNLANEALVQQWPDKVNALEQAWRVEATDSGYYRLTAQHSDKALSVSAIAATGITQAPWSGGLAQQWKPLDAGGGYYKFESRQTPGRLLSLLKPSKAIGTYLRLYPDNGTCAQKWKPEFSTALISNTSDEEFIGPFPSWANVKTSYGALGDGTTDDTAAIRRALADLGQAGKKNVLYFPAGTYRITGTLELYKVKNVSVIGEHPEQTIIRWDGAADVNMFNVKNVAASRFNRITWDGAGRADVGIYLSWGGYSSGDNFPSRFELADNIFQNLDVGIRGGDASASDQNTAAEVVVTRSKFLRNRFAGVHLNDFNTVDWWISDSLFEDNVYGVFIWPGGGHVYNSIFKRSTESDIFNSNIEYVAFRDNYSIGSKKFYLSGGPSPDPFITTLQGNFILDPQDLPIDAKHPGPLLAIDNTIRLAAGAPALHLGGQWPGNQITVGNKITSANWNTTDANYNRTRSLDDQVIPTVEVSEPRISPFAPRFTGPVFEVTALTGAAVQQAIYQADQQYRGQRPVVHLSAADYIVTQTLTIPAGSDVQLIGDTSYIGGGGCTRLLWQGAAGGTVLRLGAASRARLKDFLVHGAAGNADGLVIEGADQPGGRVYLEQPEVNAFSTPGTALLVDGLDWTLVEARQTTMGSINSSAIKIIGGAQTANGQATTARVNIFGGTYGSSATAPTIDVSGGGRLLIQDYWYENGSRRTPFLRLTDAGTVTLQSFKAQYHTLATGTTPTFSVNGLRGKLTMLAGAFYGAGPITVEGGNLNTNVFLSGSVLAWQGNGQNCYFTTFVNNAAAGKIGTLNNIFNPVCGRTWDGNQPLSNQGPLTDAVWLRDMLRQGRTQRRSNLLQPIRPGSTDVRIFRVAFEAVNNGIKIQSQ